MIIYDVRNKVYSCLFESKEDAETFCGQHGTAASGLMVHEVWVVDDSKKWVVEEERV